MCYIDIYKYRYICDWPTCFITISIIMLLRFLCKFLNTYYTKNHVIKFLQIVSFIVYIDLTAVFGGKHIGLSRTVNTETNPRWLRPCFDSSLSTIASIEDDAPVGVTAPDETHFIRRRLIVSSQECLQMVIDLRDSFVYPSCLRNGEKRQSSQRLNVTNVSIYIK